jgi:hypothetical protein
MTGAEIEWLEPRRPKQPGKEARQLRNKRPSGRHGRPLKHPARPPQPELCSNPLGCAEPALVVADGQRVPYCRACHRVVVERAAELRRHARPA